MKFALVSTALLGTVFAQYNFPASTDTVNLPSEPKSNDVVQTKPLEVNVPTFPNPNLFSLQDGSINGKVTANNIRQNIRAGQQ